MPHRPTTSVGANEPARKNRERRSLLSGMTLIWLSVKLWGAESRRSLSQVRTGVHGG